MNNAAGVGNHYGHRAALLAEHTVVKDIGMKRMISSTKAARFAIIADCSFQPACFGTTMTIQEKLAAMNIALPVASAPAAAYVMHARTGNTVFLSGHIAKKDGTPWVGQFGKNLSVEEGRIAARSVAIDLLATLQAACEGDLERVQRIVKVMSLVNSTGEFTEHHLVTNGASELFVEVFGERGKHARSAFGVAQIPTGACVEIELIAEIA